MATTVAACSDDDAGGASGDITVFAAASLTDAFTEIGAAYEAENDRSSVTFNFASSSDLAAQIGEGTEADVYASADQANMDKVTDDDLAEGGAEVFATNSLAIIVESGNPQGIETLADLEDGDLVIVTCDPEVPIGAYSQEAFTKAGVTVEPDSFEEDVKAVANKVVLGEADAGVVYTTDVTAAGDDAEGVEIPEDVNVIAEYPIATLADAPNGEGGEAFRDFVLGDAGQEILAGYGFGSP